MTSSIESLSPAAAMQVLEEKPARDGLSESAIGNIRKWLSESRYAPYAQMVADHIAQQRWQQLDNVFWTVIPFGTGGRRGRMYPIGSNAINERTIGESAQGLAEYVRDHTDTKSLSCAIAFDTRHNSVEFSRLCAEIMVANGFRVYYLDEIRSTPELSFLVRYKQCSCGIMVTASHNPPSDNAVKCYWSTGGQILPPHDRGVIDQVMQAGEIPRVDFDQAVADGRILLCRDEVDKAFITAVSRQHFDGPRDVKIVYSPLHGVGCTAVTPALKADGFADVEVFDLHAEPDGDFPNVPDHVSNPENTAVFDSIIDRAQQIGADVILVTDPDCDRLGCAAPLTADTGGPWRTFTGNQIAVLLADYVLERRSERGHLTANHYVVKTLVTTEMMRRVADSYGVQTYGDLLVGFKWIGGVMDDVGPDRFLFGAEESHGYLVGEYARDKDGAVAAMLMAELAAALKARGQSLAEKLDALYWQHGYHAERLLNKGMSGSQGMARMQSLMSQLRSDPPVQLAGMRIRAIRDYQQGTVTTPGSDTQPLEGPQGDLVILDLSETGNYVAVRPSGTEPKVKFYMFAYTAAEQLADLDATKETTEARVDQLQQELAELADGV